MPTQDAFWEKYRDPRWQRKRLEIMERAEFRCESCLREDSTLNVHHGYYRKDADPWDYPDESLHCYCENCHAKVEETLVQIRRLIGVLNSWDLDGLLGYLAARKLLREQQGEFDINGRDLVAMSSGIGDALASWTYWFIPQIEQAICENGMKAEVLAAMELEASDHGGFRQNSPRATA